MGDAVQGEVGRGAVQHDARAHPVAAHLGLLGCKAQRGSAVAERAFADDVVRGGVEGVDLVSDAARGLGVVVVSGCAINVSDIR